MSCFVVAWLFGGRGPGRFAFHFLTSSLPIYLSIYLSIYDCYISDVSTSVLHSVKANVMNCKKK